MPVAITVMLSSNLIVNPIRKVECKVMIKDILKISSYIFYSNLFFYIFLSFI